MSAAKHFLLAQQAEQQMLRTNVLVIQPLGLLCAVGEHALALVTQRQIDGRGHLLPQRGVRLDLLADRFDRRAGAKETVRERFVLPQQAQQQVLGFDARAAELALAS